jgi:hypothetical protein
MVPGSPDGDLERILNLRKDHDEISVTKPTEPVEISYATLNRSRLHYCQHILHGNDYLSIQLVNRHLSFGTTWAWQQEQRCHARTPLLQDDIKDNTLLEAINLA